MLYTSRRVKLEKKGARVLSRKVPEVVGGHLLESRKDSYLFACPTSITLQSGGEERRKAVNGKTHGKPEYLVRGNIMSTFSFEKLHCLYLYKYHI